MMSRESHVALKLSTMSLKSWNGDETLTGLSRKYAENNDMEVKLILL